MEGYFKVSTIPQNFAFSTGGIGRSLSQNEWGSKEGFSPKLGFEKEYQILSL